MTVRTDHPGPDLVAAYVDGRLTRAERAALEAHLADCPDCREWLAGTRLAVATGSDDSVAPARMEEAGRGGFVAGRAPLPWRGRLRRPWRGVAIATAAVLLLAAGLSLLLARSRPASTRVDALVRQLPPANRLVDSLWQRGVMRGPSGAGRLDRRSCLAGVLLLDARVALEAEARDPALAAIRRLADLLDGVGQLGREARALEELAARLESGQTPSTLAARLSAIEPALEERLLTGWLDLGRWTEAMRLAASTRSGEVLADRRGRSRLERLRAPATGLDAETVAALAELDAFYVSPPSAEPEWAAFASRLERLLIRTTP